MWSIADKVVAERKMNPPTPKVNDLLQKMLDGRDPVTKEGLSDENIRFNMITFLIAGFVVHLMVPDQSRHETTSGTLGFTMYYLLKNPTALKTAREEVDRVLGHRFPTVKDIPHLGYIDQCLKEALRLQPTAPVTLLFEAMLTSGFYSNSA